jgi:hypothetical protein
VAVAAPLATVIVWFWALLWVLLSNAKLTGPEPLPLAPETICRNSGFEETAVHGPHPAAGVTVKDTGISGATPQFGWPEPLGQGSTVEVPVGGKLAPGALSEIPLQAAAVLIVVESEAEALDAPPPDTATIFTCGEEAVPETFTVTVMGEYEALAPRTSLRLQELEAQVQPVPDMEIKVRPEGTVSVTVTGAVVGPALAALETVTV